MQASDVLRVLQVNTLADQTVTDKQQWDAAVRFLESSIKEKLVVSGDARRVAELRSKAYGELLSFCKIIFRRKRKRI